MSSTAAFYAVLRSTETEWEDIHFSLISIGWNDKTAERIAALTDPEWKGNYDQTMRLLSVRAQKAGATGLGSGVAGFLPVYDTFTYHGERYNDVCTRVPFTPWSFLDEVLHYSTEQMLEFFGNDFWRIPPEAINESLVASLQCSAARLCQDNKYVCAPALPHPTQVDPKEDCIDCGAACERTRWRCSACYALRCEKGWRF